MEISWLGTVISLCCAAALPWTQHTFVARKRALSSEDLLRRSNYGKAAVTVAGLVNGDDHDLVAELVGGLTSDYEAALSAGQRHRARMLLRLMAALVVVNVVQPSDVLTVLEAVVSSAIAIADAGSSACMSIQSLSQSAAGIM